MYGSWQRWDYWKRWHAILIFIKRGKSNEIFFNTVDTGGIFLLVASPIDLNFKNRVEYRLSVRGNKMKLGWDCFFFQGPGLTPIYLILLKVMLIYLFNLIFLCVTFCWTSFKLCKSMFGYWKSLQSKHFKEHK